MTTMLMVYEFYVKDIILFPVLKISCYFLFKGLTGRKQLILRVTALFVFYGKGGR